MKIRKDDLKVILGSALVGLALAHCGSGLTGDPNSTVWVQVERLARPAINEGLILTNDYLNAFNSIAPSVDLTDAASAVVNEAATVLGLVNTFATNAGLGLTPPSVANVAGGFLPDVMRIDTTLTISGSGTTDAGPFGQGGSYAYNEFVNDNVSKPIILVGGRKITDDVINITLGYLFNTSPLNAAANAAYDDGVSYYGGLGACPVGDPGGANPANPGHHCLNGQATPNAVATFPFLAAAN